jgi:hypothetical protein
MESCELSPTTVAVIWDNETGKFTTATDSTRFLESYSSLHDDGNDSDRQLRSRRLNTEDQTEQETFQARVCPCANSNEDIVFCLTQNEENVCGVRSRTITNGRPEVDCFRSSSADIFTRNALPVAVLWLVAMLLYVLTTDGGRSGLKYGLRKIGEMCCCTSSNRDTTQNNNLIEDILRREAEARRRFQLMVSNRASSQRDVVTYILKTRAFKKEVNATPIPNRGIDIKTDTNVDEVPDISSPASNNTMPLTPDSTKSLSFEPEVDEKIPEVDENEDYFDSDDEDAVTCTICIMEIEDGDRIGVLPCEHKFHVDCLKEWIKRKNSCPLCQVPGIAREKENSNNGTTESGGTSRSSRSNTRHRGRRNMHNVQRDLFHVNGEGRRTDSSRRGRMIMVGDPDSSRRGRIINVSDPTTITRIRVARRNSHTGRVAAARSRVNAVPRHR